MVDSWYATLKSRWRPLETQCEKPDRYFFV